LSSRSPLDRDFSAIVALDRLTDETAVD